MPNWKVDERFKNDVFTFVRVEYDSASDRWGGGGVGEMYRTVSLDNSRAGAAGGEAVASGRIRRLWLGMGRWATDWPDSDLNFSFRLQQLTSLKVNPDPIIDAADRRATSSTTRSST